MLLEQKGWSHKVPLGGLINRFFQSRCQDRRDKVFALLSLTDTSHWRQELKPDYAIHSVQLYVKVMQLCRYRYLDLYFHLSFIFQKALGITTGEVAAFLGRKHETETKLPVHKPSLMRAQA